MSHKITSQTDAKATLEISLNEVDLKPHVAAAYHRLRAKVNAAGFRPGKAPDAVVERELGANAVQAEVVDIALGRSYADAVTAEKLPVIAQPQVNLKSFVPYTELTYTAEVELLPKVELPDYKKVSKQPKKVEIADADINEVVDDLRRRMAIRIPAIRSAEMNDEVKFDFAGTKDGQPVAGATAKGYTLKLGSGQFIPGFEEELVGLKVGEEKKFPITFPKDYHEKELAGQEVVFNIKMLEVTQLELPAADDEFAAKVGPFKTLKELQDDIRDQLTVEKEAEAKRDMQNELLEELVKDTKITEVPSRLVDEQQERLKSELNQRLAASGMNMEMYLQAQGKDLEGLEKELRPEAEKRVKMALLLTEIAKAEKVAVDKEEIDAEIEEMRQRYTDPHILEHLDHDHTREDVYNSLMSNKVIKLLTEIALKSN